MNRILVLEIVLCVFMAVQGGCDEEESLGSLGDETSENQSSDGTGEDDSDGVGGEKGLCSGEKLAPGRYPLSLQHGGTSREYLLYVPKTIALDQPNPVVLNFHGYTSNMYQQEIFSGMNGDAEKNGFVLVYPNGLINEIDGERSWNAGGCCAYGEELLRDDIGFVRTLLAELETKVCIDKARIYATGMSNGGFMSHYLACEASDVIAAVAPVAGVMAMSPSYCTPSRPVPVIHFHGTADSVVPYGIDGEGVYLTSVPETFEGWVGINKCKSKDSLVYSKGAASCVSATECEAGVEVTLCTIEGMDHCWPGQLFCPYGGATLDISANKEMWKFFSRFTLPPGDKL